MKIKSKKKVLVAMSGGVDSSVAAFLLKKKGYEVIGVFMRLGVEQHLAEAAARRVCQKLGIKFYPVNLARQFKKEVVEYFTNSYQRGETPNPCVNCNRLIKFGELFRLADDLGCNFLATGHYVKVKDESKKQKVVFKLLRGKDENKDQSYFLYNLTQRQLKQLIFPLGDYKKEEIKKIAAKLDLPNLKIESQDVCFLSGDHNEFLKEKIKLKPGLIQEILPLVKGEKEREVKTVGQHKGLPLYTIGQRRGVELGGTGPYYVVKSDYQKNILYVTRDHDDPLLYRDNFFVRDVNWVGGVSPKLPLKCEAVIRYRHQPVNCRIVKLKVENKNNKYLVRLKDKERAITVGQSAVFYKGNEVLGGGVIEI